MQPSRLRARLPLFLAVFIDIFSFGLLYPLIVCLFLAGRLVSGLMAGTAPIAQAAMMDTAPPDQRSEAMAQVTLVNTVGFVAGPAMCGVLGHWDFRLPLGLALALCVVTVITLWSSTLAGDVAKRKFEFDWRKPFLLFVRVRMKPALMAPVLAFFLFQ